MNKYQNLVIHISNQAEKLAALYHLKKLTGLEIGEITLTATIKNLDVIQYPFVYVYGNDMVSAKCKTDSGDIIVKFKDIGKIDELLEEMQSKEVKLNSDYTAIVHKNGDVKVGCQTFKIEVIKKIIKAYESLNA